MNKIIIALIIALIAVSTTGTALAVKPVREALHLISAGQTTCGWDCIPDDGIIGLDESYQWVAQGKLTEPFTHTYLTSGNRTATVRVWGWKGKADVTITINGIVFNEKTRLRNENRVIACLEYIGDINITISGSAKTLNVVGYDSMRRTFNDCP